jgi:transcriptional regulator
MHPNALFRAQGSDTEQRALMETLVQEIGFGMVFGQTPDGPRVAQSALYSTGDGAVQFHLSRGNGLTRYLDGIDALIVVNGPDGYISPDWYNGPDQVPTWNYVSLELEGPVRAMDKEGLTALLDDLSAVNEARLASKEPWTRAKLDGSKFERMLDGITGFEMEVKAWRPTFKLSQNKSSEERLHVADELEKLGKKALAHFVRAWVK